MKLGKVNVEFGFQGYKEPILNNDYLYHYCSLESFYNIIQTKTIRLYDLREMNDISELSLENVEWIRLLCEEYRKHPFDFYYETKDNLTHDFYEYIFDEYFKHEMNPNSRHNTYYFAFCMTKLCNDLNQWRLYGDNCKGICLAFNKDTLKKTGFDLVNIEYVDIDNMVSTIISDVLSKTKNASYNKDNRELEKFRFDLLGKIKSEFYKYKNNAYSNEKEIRLVKTIKTRTFAINCNTDYIMQNDYDIFNEIKFTIKNKRLVGYCDVNIDDLGLEEIILGPLNETTKASIMLFLAKNGINIKNDCIFKSTIPYR